MTAATSSKTLGRVKLVAILSMFAVPFIIATVWFNQLKTTGEATTSRANGLLVSPARPLAEFSQMPLEGSTVQTLADVKDRWSLLYFHSGECAEQCAKILYDSRQVRISLGREMHRVRRVLVTDTPLTDELLQIHQQLETAGADSDSNGLKAQVRAEVGNEVFDNDLGQWYLVDPLGNLMMRFPSELPQKLFLKDLKVLLKASRIG